MATKSIFEFGELTTPATNDVIPIVDVSDPTQSLDGSTKKITYDNLMQFIEADITTLDTIKVNYTDKLSALAETTSSELAGVITDETGSGSLVFGTQPTIDTPTLTTPKVDHINEATSAHGVVIDGVTLKDNDISAVDLVLSGIETVDTINEYTTDNGVVINNTTTIKSTGLTSTGITKLGNDNDYTTFSTSGAQEMAGNARVYKSLQVPANAVKATGYTPPTEGILGFNHIFIFANNKEESLSITVRIVDDLDRTEPTQFLIAWSSPATTGHVKWKIEYIRRADGEDMSSTTPDETLYVLTAPSTTSNGHTFSSVTLQPASANDVVNSLKITRLTSDPEDDLEDVVNLTGFVFYYISNKLGNNFTSI